MARLPQKPPIGVAARSGRSSPKTVTELRGNAALRQLWSRVANRRGLDSASLGLLFSFDEAVRLGERLWSDVSPSRP
jgi:hypothetical protein